MSFRLDRISVLVVDDSPHMLNLLCDILRGLGINTIHTAQDAVDAFKEIKITRPNLVICDQAMEPICGIEFTRLLRTSHDSPDIHVPIIMVTGYCDTLTVLQARDAGVNEFLAKPISAKALYLRLLEVINNPRDFVKTKSYTGPDRQRRSSREYDGPERRKSREAALRNAEVDALMEG
jgi:CheY-like chemotaxis protein